MTETAPPPRDRPYTIKELAERWACSTETVLRKIRKGELPCIEINARNLLVPHQAVEEYESARTVLRVLKPLENSETLTPNTTPSPGPSAPKESPEAASSRRVRLTRRARATR